jgi:hypothetical protein
MAGPRFLGSYFLFTPTSRSQASPKAARPNSASSPSPGKLTFVLPVPWGLIASNFGGIPKPSFLAVAQDRRIGPCLKCLRDREGTSTAVRTVGCLAQRT